MLNNIILKWAWQARFQNGSKHYEPWLDCSQGAVWSGSILFAIYYIGYPSTLVEERAEDKIMNGRDIDKGNYGMHKK